MVQDTERDDEHERTDLDSRYGSIGIAAVAAAVRYQEGARNSNKPRKAKRETSS